MATSTWEHWETGARFPKGKKRLDLATYTGIPLHLLICHNIEDRPQFTGNGKNNGKNGDKTF